MLASSEGRGAESPVRIGTFTLYPKKRLLTRDGDAVPLGPKVVETLTALVENAGELVTKDVLMERLWPDQFVEEANLVQNVHRLRKALASGGLERAIETMPRRGYRFVAEVGQATTTPPAFRRHAVALRAVAATVAVLLFGQGAPPPLDAFARLHPESQRSYLLGRYHLNLRFSPTQAEQSLRYFRRVVQLDPSNPLGYSGSADAYLARFDTACNSTIASCRGTAALAVANARRAVALGPNSAQAHTSYAMVLYVFGKNYARSDAEFKDAIALDGGYALAHHWFANTLLMRGRFDAARTQYRQAIALDPTSPTTYAWLAEDEYLSHRYDRAIEYARESLALYSSRPLSWALLGLAYEQLGASRSARAAFDTLPGSLATAFTAELDARSGKRDRALHALRLVRPDSAAFGTLELALAWNALGNRSIASSYLRRIRIENWIQRRFAEMDPRLSAMRGTVIL
jgi:DNA-binding winged helix-turn-helix (wHTH) protein/tetratricopeptide (TPR) repeat protein